MLLTALYYELKKLYKHVYIYMFLAKHAILT